jgi:hypothetical protein
MTMSSQAYGRSKKSSDCRKGRNPHIGQSFDAFLKEQGIYESVQTTAMKRVQGGISINFKQSTVTRGSR